MVEESCIANSCGDLKLVSHKLVRLGIMKCVYVRVWFYMRTRARMRTDKWACFAID